MTTQNTEPNVNDTWQVVGKGQVVSGDTVVTGTVAEIKETADVLALLDEAPDDLIVLMHTSGGTILSPLFADLRGVICTTGSKGSHVAILSREFGVACIMAAGLTEPDLSGRRVRLQPDGEIQVTST